MRNLFVFGFGLGLILLTFVSPANSEELSIDDLLIPDVPFINDNAEVNEELDQKPMQKVPKWDDLLGPEDNFPFLPDNHRDSGTGKFNSI